MPSPPPIINVSMSVRARGLFDRRFDLLRLDAGDFDAGPGIAKRVGDGPLNALAVLQAQPGFGIENCDGAHGL